MPAIIFLVLLVLVVFGVVGLVVNALQTAIENILAFVTPLPVPLLVGFGVVLLFLVAVVAVKNASLLTGALAGIGICFLLSLPILIVPPLVHGRQWNHKFDCFYDGPSGCDRGNRCIGRGRRGNEFGFCVAPFGFDYMGMAEFTQGQYRKYLHEQFQKECDAMTGKSIRKIEKELDCIDSIEEKVEARFKNVTSPEKCDYLTLAGNADRALRIADEAPMPCLGADEAARVCGFFGGRLPTGAEFRSLFDDRDVSCKNTEMIGTEHYTGLQKKLKSREIRSARGPGPGCGHGRFGRVCGRYRRGNTDEGFCDVFGNLAEWTSDSGALGGSFMSAKTEILDEIKSDKPRIDIGFRCLVPGDSITDPIDRH